MEKNKDIKAQQVYPGAGTDQADNGKVDPKLVKEDIKDLNNNPRNNSLDE
ncbi:MAG: hypothetical protein K2G27_00885 [Duncaniella sp.]|nr:hypothetical protein [Bacteroides sp.]MDE6065362.1 hypothetical protein [Duncaniella sp.]